MKFHSILAVTVALLAFTATGQSAQVLTAQSSTTPVQSSAASSPTQVKLFTISVLEPNGSVAVCLATNLDAVARELTAQIVDAKGADVTQTSSCGARVGAGATCDATAHFANNSPLRCVVSTSGSATTLRGGMTTSSGPFPFISPANLTVPAQ